MSESEISATGNDQKTEVPDELTALIREIDQKNTQQETAGTPDNELGVTRDSWSGLEDAYVAVELGGHRLAVDMQHVLEVQRVPDEVTWLPGVPEWVMGVTNLRGNILSVINFAGLLGLPESDSISRSRRLVVFQSLVDELQTGFVVDRVVGKRSIPASSILKPSAPIESPLSQHMLGMAEEDGGLLAIFDIEKLLLSTDFRQFEAA